jgi:hypothetical protein
MPEKQDPSWKVNVEQMTPDRQREALRNNYINRPIIGKTVERLAKDMREGRWQHPTVIWRNGGKLVDGQHRFTAGIKENFTLWCVMIDGVSTEVIDTIDSGTRRTDAQRLQMHDYDKTISGLLGSALGFLVNYKEHNTISGGNVSFIQKWELLGQHPDVADYARHWQSLEVHGLVAKRALLAAFHWLAAKVDKEKADEFFSQIAEESPLENSPSAIFREFVSRLEDPKAQNAPRIIGIYLLQMWQKAQNGEELKKRPAISAEVPRLHVQW